MNELNTNKNNEIKTNENTSILKFLLFSVLGIGFFLVPVFYGGKWTIGIAILSSAIEGAIGGGLSIFIGIAVVASSILTVIAVVLKPKFILENERARNMFCGLSPFWLIVRLSGAIFIMLILFKIGPQYIWAAETGGEALAIVNSLAVVLSVSSFLIYFLLDFGLMELVGTIVSPLMRPLFKLPGRSALDCIASWMGSASVGVVLTSTQYDEGYYSDREACIVSTCFSLVSVTFCLFHMKLMGVDDYFVPIYLTICIIGVINAIILPRIYPLNKKKDNYNTSECTMISEEIPVGTSRLKWAMICALKKSSEAPSIATILKNGVWAALDVWFTLLPVVLSFATIGLILANFTSVFTIISAPLVPVLELMGLPDAKLAAPAMLTGFPEQLIASVIGSKIPSLYTRAVTLIVILSQLIYMSEVGVILLKSKMSISFKDLCLIYLERTVISLPLAMVFVGFFIDKV